MCSAPLSVGVVACLTSYASVLGKSVDKAGGLPPLHLQEAETWQSMDCGAGKPGSCSVASRRVQFFVCASSCSQWGQSEDEGVTGSL